MVVTISFSFTNMVIKNRKACELLRLANIYEVIIIAFFKILKTDFSTLRADEYKRFIDVKDDYLKFHFQAIFNKTPAKHRDIFLRFGLHQLSHSHFGRGNRI